MDMVSDFVHIGRHHRYQSHHGPTYVTYFYTLLSKVLRLIRKIEADYSVFWMQKVAIT